MAIVLPHLAQTGTEEGVIVIVELAEQEIWLVTRNIYGFFIKITLSVPI